MDQQPNPTPPPQQPKKEEVPPPQETEQKSEPKKEIKSEPKKEEKPETKKEEKPISASNSKTSLKYSSQELLDEEDSEEEVYQDEILDESRKKTINLVFIGHVDAGKSTLSGHVLFEAGIVDQRTIEHYQREAQQNNRQSWYFSWVMDHVDTESQKGKTEEVGIAHFETNVYKYTVLDAPGHRSYVPQMIGCSS